MPSINLKVIEDLRALQSGSPGFLVELIDLFLKEAAVLLAKLQTALGTRDAGAFERAAHTLKGSCGNLGAQAMSRLCAELQTAGQAADWKRASELVSKVLAEFRLVQSELEAEKAR